MRGAGRMGTLAGRRCGAAAIPVPLPAPFLSSQLPPSPTWRARVEETQVQRAVGHVRSRRADNGHAHVPLATQLRHMRQAQAACGLEEQPLGQQAAELQRAQPGSTAKPPAAQQAGASGANGAGQGAATDTDTHLPAPMKSSCASSRSTHAYSAALRLLASALGPTSKLSSCAVGVGQRTCVHGARQQLAPAAGRLHTEHQSTAAAAGARAPAPTLWGRRGPGPGCWAPWPGGRSRAPRTRSCRLGMRDVPPSNGARMSSRRNGCRGHHHPNQPPAW